mmetsp:Transcript_372/g.831  ORF Transcript_372/g.831 Transcript_372/m.831 type:complete len:353 (-) Transcript_372:571-1629(-)
MALPMRPLGSQGLKVTMQGFGCMGLTAFYGKPVALEVGLEVLDKAYELGVRFFDTAEIYQSKVGEKVLYNETLVGKWLAKGGKEDVVVATKYWPLGSEKSKCTEESVREAVKASAERLGVDCIDLYYLHRVPPDEGALESFMKTMKALVAEGKVKYVGLSEATPEEIRFAHAIQPVTAVQQEWSMLIRNLEEELVPACREMGIGIVAYSPLCRGFTSALVKKPEDWSKIGNEAAGGSFQSICPHLSADNVEVNAALLAPLEAAAAQAGVTAAQMSLAWVHSRGDDVFPIPGTTKIANLESNVQGAHLALKTPKSVFDQLGQDVDHTKVSGDRYPEARLQFTFEARSKPKADA